ncbi:single-stranded DNA-binding protein [Ligilactobacillus agilis]|uniref:single-stranded DNA-binding protein n=1 Tax=Ligilactobacillus agilis TaxID=1601 RepID=UPI00143804B5|nr:single-stranded DNA-binding protein [Ligilactobacillus agilis]GET18352.1 single-stranded DNA-binding protein [Ligilactobacillus agilis]
MNNVQLIGRIAQDLELRKTQNDRAWLSFSLALNEYSNGEQHTTFIDCVAWQRNAEILAQYAHKGALIGLEGRLQRRNYTDRNGQNRSIVEVVVNHVELLGSRGQSDSQETTNTASSNDWP